MTTNITNGNRVKRCRVKRDAKWVMLYRYDEEGLLTVIYEPLRSYEVHNLLQKGWRDVSEMSNLSCENESY